MRLCCLLFRHTVNTSLINGEECNKFLDNETVEKLYDCICKDTENDLELLGEEGAFSEVECFGALKVL